MGMGNMVNGWAGGFATGLFGYHQYLEGKKMKKALGDRPEYKIPGEISQAAQEGLPEAQKQYYRQQQDRLLASSLNASNSRKGGLAGLAAVNQQQADANSNMLAQDSAARQQNQLRMADYRDQAFQFNKVNPYYEGVAEYQAMTGAGIQNMGNAFQIAGGNAGSNAYSKPEQSNKQANNRSGQWGNIDQYNYNQARGGAGTDAGDQNQGLDTSGYV